MASFNTAEHFPNQIINHQFSGWGPFFQETFLVHFFTDQLAEILQMRVNRPVKLNVQCFHGVQSIRQKQTELVEMWLGDVRLALEHIYVTDGACEGICFFWLPLLGPPSGVRLDSQTSNRGHASPSWHLRTCSECSLVFGREIHSCDRSNGCEMSSFEVAEVIEVIRQHI